jgi:hypothetical protein
MSTNRDQAYAEWRDKYNDEPTLHQAFMAGWNAAVQPPTREQIAEAIDAAVIYDSTFDAEVIDPHKAADAVLALFPQPKEGGN